MFFYMWSGVEDMLLEAIAVYALARPCRHISLHFGGVMVDPDAAGDVDEFAAACSRVVEDQTGYVVQFERKVHYALLDEIKAKARMRMEIGGSQSLLADGNCIPAAAAFVTAQVAQLEAEAAKNNLVNRRAASNKYRSYKEGRMQFLGD